MSEFAIKAPAQVTISIKDSDQILLVRRACAASAGTMRRMPSTWGTADREPPFFFQENPCNLYIGDAFS